MPRCDYETFCQLLVDDSSNISNKNVRITVKSDSNRLLTKLYGINCDEQKSQTNKYQQQEHQICYSISFKLVHSKWHIIEPTQWHASTLSIIPTKTSPTHIQKNKDVSTPKLPVVTITKDEIKEKYIYIVQGYARDVQMEITQDVLDLILFFYAKPIIMNVKSKYCSDIKSILFCPLEPEWSSLEAQIFKECNLDVVLSLSYKYGTITKDNWKMCRWNQKSFLEDVFEVNGFLSGKPPVITITKDEIKEKYIYIVQGYARDVQMEITQD
eukprot:283857_1